MSRVKKASLIQLSLSVLLSYILMNNGSAGDMYQLQESMLQSSHALNIYIYMKIVLRLCCCHRLARQLQTDSKATVTQISTHYKQRCAEGHILVTS